MEEISLSQSILQRRLDQIRDLQHCKELAESKYADIYDDNLRAFCIQQFLDGYLACRKQHNILPSILNSYTH